MYSEAIGTEQLWGFFRDATYIPHNQLNTQKSIKGPEIDTIKLIFPSQEQQAGKEGAGCN